MKQKIFTLPKINFAFFSTIDNPLLPLIIKKTSEYKLKNVFIICDQSKTSYRMQKVFKERVGSFFDKFDIYKTKHKIPFFFVDDHNSRQTFDLLKKLKIDCLYNAGTLNALSCNVIMSLLLFTQINE